MASDEIDSTTEEELAGDADGYVSDVADQRSSDTQEASSDVVDAASGTAYEATSSSWRVEAVDVGLDPISKRPILEFADGEAKEQLCDILGVALAEGAWRVQAPAQAKSTHRWRHITLRSETEKFAVGIYLRPTDVPSSHTRQIVKRTMQLTGIRISDAMINGCSTPASLLTALTAEPKDIKVAKALSKDRKLQDTTNVAVYDRPLTSRDEDEQLGRWKVIERSLKLRALPSEKLTVEQEHPPVVKRKRIFHSQNRAS